MAIFDHDLQSVGDDAPDPEGTQTQQLVDPAMDGLRLFLKAVRRIRLLGSCEEQRLAQRAAQGDPAARHRLIEAHLPLVVAIARGYVNRGVPLLDLIQEGTLGLHAAVDGFDPQRGARVSTYATWLIRSTIQRAIVRQARTVRVPSDVLAKLGLICRVEVSIMTSEQRMPTHADTADIAAAAGMTVEEMDWVRLHTAPEISIDAPMGSDRDGWCLLDLIADYNAASPYESCVTSTVIDVLRDALRHLTDRERTVLDRRYGLTDGIDQTLTQIGHTVGVTRERVRQIEEQALRKLQILVNARLGPDPLI
jgi:RNA polymerase primary sigma factor